MVRHPGHSDESQVIQTYDDLLMQYITNVSFSFSVPSSIVSHRAEVVIEFLGDLDWNIDRRVIVWESSFVRLGLRVALRTRELPGVK